MLGYEYTLAAGSTDSARREAGPPHKQWQPGPGEAGRAANGGILGPPGRSQDSAATRLGPED